MVGGATPHQITRNSAWYAPGASVAYLVDSIINDQKRMIPCSVYLEGEYGQNDICIGVPCIIGRSHRRCAIEREQAKFDQSAAAVRNMNDALGSVLS